MRRMRTSDGFLGRLMGTPGRSRPTKIGCSRPGDMPFSARYFRFETPPHPPKTSAFKPKMFLDLNAHTRLSPLSFFEHIFLDGIDTLCTPCRGQRRPDHQIRSCLLDCLSKKLPHPQTGTLSSITAIADLQLVPVNPIRCMRRAGTLWESRV